MKDNYTMTVHPDGTLSFYRLGIDEGPGLVWLQQEVDGYIEVAPSAIGGVKLVVNEEGLLDELPLNPVATAMLHPDTLGVVLGNAVVLRKREDRLVGMPMFQLCLMLAEAENRLEERRDVDEKIVENLLAEINRGLNIAAGRVENDF